MPCSTIPTVLLMTGHATLDTDRATLLHAAAQSLLHAVIDDGCSCTTAPEYDTEGNVDRDAWRARDDRYRSLHPRGYYLGLHNPHTQWGSDVLLAVAALAGTEHELTGQVAVGAQAIDLTPYTGDETVSDQDIPALEAALREVLDLHMRNELSEENQPAASVARLRELLKGTAYQYGA